MTNNTKYGQPKKAIIPAAGFGTRTLPLSKSIPKEMLPVWNKPVIQYVVEDLVSAGVEEIIIVTSPSKKAVEDYFSEDEALDTVLRSKGKDELADELLGLQNLAKFVFVRQHGAPKGNQLPVANAKYLIKPDEPFFVMWADDFFQTGESRSRCQQLLDVYSQTGNSVIALIDAGPDAPDRYAIPIIDKELGDGVYHLKDFLEKPGRDKIQSPLASVGGFVLTPDALPLIGTIDNHHPSGETFMADVIGVLARDGKVDAKLIDGKFQDGGDIFKYATSVVDLALADKKQGEAFLDYLTDAIKDFRMNMRKSDTKQTKGNSK